MHRVRGRPADALGDLLDPGFHSPLDGLFEILKDLGRVDRRAAERAGGGSLLPPPLSALRVQQILRPDNSTDSLGRQCIPVEGAVVGRLDRDRPDQLGFTNEKDRPETGDFEVFQVAIVPKHEIENAKWCAEVPHHHERRLDEREAVNAKRTGKRAAAAELIGKSFEACEEIHVGVPGRHATTLPLFLSNYLNRRRVSNRNWFFQHHPCLASGVFGSLHAHGRRTQGQDGHIEHK